MFNLPILIKLFHHKHTLKYCFLATDMTIYDKLPSVFVDNSQVSITVLHKSMQIHETKFNFQNQFMS